MEDEKKVPAREKVNKSMVGIYDVLNSIVSEGGLPSVHGSSVRELIKILESGVGRFDTEIDMGFGKKATVQSLVENIITKCTNEAEFSRNAAGQDTEYAKKLLAFVENLKEVTYGDLKKDRTIN